MEAGFPDKLLGLNAEVVVGVCPVIVAFGNDALAGAGSTGLGREVMEGIVDASLTGLVV